MSILVTDVALTLRDLRDLFREPELDPFAGEDTDESGIDRLLDILKADDRWRRSEFRLTLSIPEAEITPDVELKIRRAMGRYCDGQIQYNRRKLTQVRTEGRRSLRIGGLFLAACLGLAALAETLFRDEGLLGTLVVEGLFIAGWVGLWQPVDLLLYAWWPYADEIKLHEKIRRMELIVKAAPGL